MLSSAAFSCVTLRKQEKNRKNNQSKIPVQLNFLQEYNSDERTAVPDDTTLTKYMVYTRAISYEMHDDGSDIKQRFLLTLNDDQYQDNSDDDDGGDDVDDKVDDF